MKKERTIITIDEYGKLNMPSNTANVWMTEAELTELFNTTAGAVHTSIKPSSKKTPCNKYTDDLLT